MILYFHRLSLSSLVLNIVVSVLLAALAAVALAALLVAQVSASLAWPLLKLAEAINWLMVHSVDPFSDAGIASLRLPEYSGWPRWIYVLYYLPLLFLVMKLDQWEPMARSAKNKRGTPLTLVQSLLIVILIVHPFSASHPDGRLHVDFLDVGQGDAALITMPDGTTVLVDGGGRPRFRTELVERESRSIGESVVSEYLWWRGLSRVDYILATHADADHIDGLSAVAKNFRVGGALVGRAPSDDAEFARFKRTAREAGTPVYRVVRGDVLRFGAVTVEVLWPPKGDADAPSANDDSVVLRLRYGRRIFLLTGDAEADAERALVSAGDALRCDALKVAHHGSRTSSTEAFVKA